MNDPYGLEASELSPELIAQLSGARTQRAIAEAMLKQSMAPLEVQQPKGRFQGVVSPLEAIAKLTQGMAARSDMAASDRVAETVAKQQAMARDKAMADYLRTKNGVPGTAPLTQNDDEGNPMPTVGGVKGDPRAAIAQAIMNKVMPRDFIKWEQSALDKADNREDQQRFLKSQAEENAKNRAEQARLAREQRMAELQARLEDARISREDRAALMKELAAMRGAMRPDQPPTLTTIIDPKNPSQTITVDARVYKQGGSLGDPGVFGVGTKLSDSQKMEAKRQFNMQGIGATIQRADDLLDGKGIDGTRKGATPTQSGVGSVVDSAASLVGVTPSGAAEADALKSVAGALTAKMPRMEGPQSDKDVLLYKEMAGQVGNDRLPIERRKSALSVVKDLWSKYERLNPDAFAGAAPVPAGGDEPPPGAVRRK